MIDQPTTRRRFLERGALAVGGATLALGSGCSLTGGDSEPAPRPLVRDPGGMLDLPPGFQYRVLSDEGSRMAGGAEVPGAFDGMAATAGPGGTTVLIRNHELGVNATSSVPAIRPFDRRWPGGTTALVVGRDRRVVRELVTSSGTLDNCAGGLTPWGTWLTCEEDRRVGHGYVFEVDPGDPASELSRTPIEAMGRFSHEAVAVDPITGVVYLTEDNSKESDDPEIAGPSFLYRYLPRDRRRAPGALQRGGILQALALDEPPAGGAGELRPDRGAAVRWLGVSPRSAPEEARAKGCAAFERLEGCTFGDGALWFSDTLGGRTGAGQLFRFRPRTGTLELFHESGAESELQQPDNVVVAPWGDLVVCSDIRSRLLGLTPGGDLYPIAQSRFADSEMCGPTFAPDGRTLFVNIQEPGMTFAIWGPFGRLGGRRGDRRRAGRTSMARATPPRGEGPRVSGELAEAAQRHGLTSLEAAAYERLGVPL